MAWQSFVSSASTGAKFMREHRNHRRTVLTVLGLGLTGAAYVRRAYKLQVAPELIEAIPIDTGVTVIPRDAGRHIRILAANRVHMLVLGPHGVGKTISVKQAIDSHEEIQTIDHPTTFLPFYVNLSKAVPPLTKQHALDADAARRVVAAFKRESEKFEARQLAAAHSGFMHLLKAQIGDDWATIVGAFTHPAPPVDTPPSASIRTYLQRVLDAATFAKEVHFITQRRGFIPVVAIDEVHLLDDAALSPIRDEFMAFLGEALADKRSAPVVIILLSSDGNAENIINSWSKRGTLSRLLQAETVGDVCEGDELRRFLLALPHAVKAPKAEPTNREAQKHTSPPSDLGVGLEEKTIAQEARSNARTRQAEDTAAAEQGMQGTHPPPSSFSLPSAEPEHVPVYQKVTYASGLERYIARVTDPDGFKHLSARYGGYIPDLIRLYSAQILKPAKDVNVSDESPVSRLIEDPVQSLKRAGLDSSQVMQVFDAIASSKLSPKGAVVIDVLQAKGIPTEFIHRMQALNLLELRRYTPPALDYEQLEPLSCSVYVCATCPLARESMTKVVEKLRAIDAKKRWPSS